MTRWSQSLGIALLLLLVGNAGLAATQGESDIVSLEGPRSLDLDINADGIGDLVFANYSAKGNIHSHFSYSINIRDKSDADLFHHVHIYRDGYPGDPGDGQRLLTDARSAECIARTHFLVRDEDGVSYELLTAEKIDGRFPPRAGTVEFTFHRLRTLETVGPAWYVFNGYRKVRSRQQYCDVVEAAKQEVFAVRGGVGQAAHDKKEPTTESAESVE